MNAVYLYFANIVNWSIRGEDECADLVLQRHQLVKKNFCQPCFYRVKVATLLLLSDGGIPSSISAVGGGGRLQPDRLLTKLPQVPLRPTSPTCPSLCLVGSFSTWGRSSPSSSSSSSISRRRKLKEEQGCRRQAPGKCLSRASSLLMTPREIGWFPLSQSRPGSETPR